MWSCTAFPRQFTRVVQAGCPRRILPGLSVPRFVWEFGEVSVATLRQKFAETKTVYIVDTNSRPASVFITIDEKGSGEVLRGGLQPFTVGYGRQTPRSERAGSLRR
jgi:hypothetical protein